jgi:hypothetical protein
VSDQVSHPYKTNHQIFLQAFPLLPSLPLMHKLPECYLQPLSPHTNHENHSTRVFPTALPKKDVLIISYTSDIFFLSLKQTTMLMHHSFKSAIRKSDSILITNNNKCQLTSYTASSIHEAQYSTTEDTDTILPWQYPVYTTCTVTAGNFGCAFILSLYLLPDIL